MKNLPKRYVSEDAVKHALKIDSFRNLSKDKGDAICINDTLYG